MFAKKSLIFIIGLVILIGIVSAIPIPLPQAFYGNINIDDGKNANGQILKGYIAENEAGSVIINKEKFDIVLTDRTGKGGKVEFYIGNERANEIFDFNVFEVIRTNLTFKTIDKEIPEDEEDSEGNSGNEESSSNKNNNKDSSFNTLSYFCEPSWECGGWSECIDDISTRKCVDKNNCGIEYNFPSEIRSCGFLSSLNLLEKNEFNWKNIFIAGLVLVVILIITIGVINFRK